MIEKFDREKFKALVHYVIWKAGAEDGFGATKLNKVLWFADARAFSLFGKSITGAKYVRLQFGPVPHQIMPVRQELQNLGIIQQWKDKTYGNAGPNVWKFKATVKPDVRPFNNEELKIVDWWVDYINDKTANEISEESHDYGWEIASMNEELPFHSFLAARVKEEPSSEAMDWGKKRAKEMGLI
jgi:hypothetical protein